MLNYFLKPIYRNFLRNKTTFIVNLISLSTGLACAILIFMWVNTELNVDKFHENDSRLYQVMQIHQFPDKIDVWDYSPALLRQALIDEFPEIEYAVSTNTRFFDNKGLISVGDDHMEIKCKYASKDFFKVFSFHLLQGDVNRALEEKNGAVISEDLAKKLFGTTENLIGKTFTWQGIGSGIYHVTGILDKLPSNSTMKFNILFSYEVITSNLEWVNRWGGDGAETYLVLKVGVNIEDFNVKIADFLKKKPTRSQTLFLQKFSDRYLYGNYENGVIAGGRIDYVKLFSVVALFILIIACVNFMNLTTAKVSGKMKEVGIKKAIGSNRKTLIIQFVSESMIMTLLSVIIAVVLIISFLPVFNLINGKQLGMNLDFGFILSVLCIILLTGIISGIYPAFYLSGFKPAVVLKGSRLKSSFGEIWLRQALVIFQFTISIILIVGFLMINKQVGYIQAKNLGYKKYNILCFARKGRIEGNDQTFMSELEKLPGVEKATNLFGTFLENNRIGNNFNWEGKTEEQQIVIPCPMVGYNFFETLGIEFIEGRPFSKEFNDNRGSVIINEAAAQWMGIENPVGKTISNFDGDVRIVGIVKNFNMYSLHEKMRPYIIECVPNGRNILVKIKPGAEVATIKNLEKLYTKFHPQYPFEFTFLDQEYQALYESEMRVASLSKYFAGMAILISCLGLFVLAAYTVERKTKEIGIRKMNGATITNVMVMLNKDFVKWVIISFLIGGPISYYTIKLWLENFAYKTELSWWIFVLTGILALGIALITVSWQSWRAAMRNPVEALRYE